jgi:hypothetical protein
VSHQRRYADLVTALRRHRNQAKGYWVASSTSDAANQALTGGIPRLEVRRAALLSDGATRLADLFGVMAWPRVFDLLDREGPSSLIMQTREAESSDPNGRRWPRSKRHDDAAPSYAGSDGTRKTSLHHFKAGLGVASRRSRPADP